MPSVRSVGALASGTTSVTPGLPAGAAEDDILALFVETGHSGPQLPDGAPSGYTQVFQGSEGTSNTAVALTIYLKRATASESDPTVNLTGGNHIHAFMAAVQDVDTAVAIASLIVGAEFSDVTATMTLPGVTTTEDASLVLMCLATTFNGNSTDKFASHANANLSGIAEHFDESETTGSGGGLGLASGTKATAGATGDSTVTTDAIGAVGVHIVLPPAAVSYTLTQPHFRIRSDDSQTLNADAGWAANLDTNATIDAETIFRARFEVETADSPGALAFKLQYRRNGGAWTDVLRPDQATATAAIEIVDSAQFTDNDATTNLLSGSGRTFEAGAGIDADNLTPSITLADEHTEYEFPLRMRVSYGDAPDFGTTGRNEDGDTFELRLVESGGAVFTGTYVAPTVTLNIPAGLIGGTIIETPHRIGPFKDTNGNLYVLLEHAEVAPYMLMVKSTDGGDTWTAPDRANGPQERDLECVDVQQVGDTLHILHVGTAILYHTFRMSDDASPDTWGITDEVVHTWTTEPQDQSGGISVRSDGTIVAAYNTDPSGTAEQQGYRIRSGGGTWGSETILDAAGGAADFTDVVAVLGESDKTHLFYVDNPGGVVWHKSLTSAGVLSAREQVATGLDTGNSREHPLTPARYYDDGGSEKVVVGYTKNGDSFSTNSVIDDGSPGTEQQVTATAVANNVGASDHPAAFIAVDGTDIYAFWADDATRDLWQDANANLAGWGADTEILDATAVDLVFGEIFTHSAGNGGAKVAGMVFDRDSLGGTGKLHYTEWPVPAAGDPDLSASIDSDIPAFTSTSTAEAVIEVAVDSDIPAFASASTAEVLLEVAVASDIPAFASAAVAEALLEAAAASDLPAFTQAASAVVEGVAAEVTIASDLPAFTQAATAEVEGGPATAEVASDLPAFTSAAVAEVLSEAAIASTLPAFTQEAAAIAVGAPVEDADASIASVLPAFTQRARAVYGGGGREGYVVWRFTNNPDKTKRRLPFFGGGRYQ